MKDLLNLPAEKIETIREQIEKVVSTQLILQENKKKQRLLKLIDPIQRIVNREVKVSQLKAPSVNRDKQAHEESSNVINEGRLDLL